MALEWLFIIGRVLFGGFFLFSGMNHFLNTKQMAQYAKSKNVPSPKGAVTLSGLMIILGGLGVILGVYVDWSILLLAIFLVVVSVTMHDFWAVPKKQQQAEMTNFLKNMALLGASLMLLQLSQPWLWSLW